MALKTPYRAPSVKRLMERLKIDKDQATKVRALLHKEVKTTDFKSVQDWERQSYNRPSYIERLLCALNEVMGTYGVEYLTNEIGLRAYYAYMNVGDPYIPTLIYNYDNDSFYIGCYGDVVEWDRRLNY